MHRDSLRNGNGGGKTESDAAHIRFREHKPTQIYECTSCHLAFEASNHAEIVLHFERKVHKQFEECLYCQGPVYKYRTVSGITQSYHNCLPYKRQHK